MNRVLAAGLFAFTAMVAPTANAQPKGKPHIEYKYDKDMNFGVKILRDPSGKEVNKQLTYNLNGSTNDAVVRIDGKDFPFKGKWISTNKKTNEGSSSVWSHGKLTVEQILHVRKGEDGILDTLLVRYILRNNDTRAHKAGFRIMLDSAIGSKDNDGVPFRFSSSDALIKTKKEFRGDQVPEWVEALEKPNLKNPGTVAHLTLKWGLGYEAPDQVAVTKWRRTNYTWDVPLKSMGTDSCLVLYWNEKSIPAGGKRQLAFAYGTLAKASLTDKAIEAKIVKRLKAKGGKKGNPQISLSWNNTNDLDLHVIDPSGERIWYSRKRSKSGGTLDVDANARSNNATADPVENIYWPTGKAPKGRYKIIVKHYRKAAGNADPTRFTVRLSIGGSSRLFHGQLVNNGTNSEATKAKVLVHQFDVK